MLFINKIFLSVLIVFFTHNLIIAQSNNLNSYILNKKVEQLKVAESEETGYGLDKNSKGIGSFFIGIYQEYISAVIAADCIYSLSCSRYGKASIHTHGFFKGLLASGDRLMRCSGIAARDIPEHKFNEEGYVEDHP